MPLAKTRNVCIICLRRFTLGDKNNFSLEKPNSAGLLVSLQSIPSASPLTTVEINHDKKEIVEGAPIKCDNDFDDLYIRFLLFVNRYLKLRTDRLLRCANDVKNENGEKIGVHAFCEHCHQLVSYICDLYKELQTIKLNLVWKLSEVGQLMKKSTKSVSQKLARGLVVSMSQQLRVQAVKPVDTFRKALQLRCFNALKNSTPNVKVHKGLFPDEWKFTYSATKNALIRLIVVFILASSQVDCKPAVESDRSPRRIRQRRGCPKSKVKTTQNLENSIEATSVQGKQENITLEGENDVFVDDENDDIQNDSDSDWSRGAASPISVVSGGSEVSQAKKVEAPSRNTRWNLRKRRNTKLRSGEDEKNTHDTENDNEENDWSKSITQKKRRRKMGIGTKKAELKCPQCPKLFVDARGLAKHLNLIHRSNIQYSCNKCGMRFKKREDLRVHNRKIHVALARTAGGIIRRGRNRNPISSTCATCSEVFPTYAEMIRHRKRSHKIVWSKHECPYCFKTVVGEARLKMHMESHENNTLKEVNLWYCEVCIKHFYKEDSLQAHMNDAHEGKYICAICNSKHDTGKLLRGHLITHETDEKQFHCQICFNSFTTQQFFDIHRKLAHMDKRRHLCNYEQCNEIFDAIPDLNEHLKSHIEGKAADQKEDGDGKELKILFCTICEMGFLKEYTLTIHELLHTPHSATGKGYDCPKCNKNVRYKETLVSHYNMKHGQKIKPYKCDICQTEFTNQLWFRTHVRLHEERISGNNFMCDVCGAQCLDSIALSAHRRCHDPNKKGRNSGVLQNDSNETERQNAKIKFNRRTQIDILLDPSSPPPPGSEIARRRRRGRPRIRPWTEEDLEKEKELLEQSTKISCNVENCEQIFKSAYLLRKHLENIHEEEMPNIEKNIQCYFCYKRYKYRQTYDMHIRATHKNKIYCRFKCDMETCEVNQFPTVEELNDHLKTHLEPGKEISFCVKCNWGFVRPELRDIHELIHIEAQENGKFSCPKCNAAYDSLRYLQYHFNIDHGMNLKPHKCEECEKRYFSKGSLVIHKLWHAKRRNLGPKDLDVLVCVECGFTYNDEYKFRKHMKEHNPENFKTCTEPGCGQTFKNHKQLWYHFRKWHDKRTKWICELCGYKFTYKHHLLSHIKTHEDPKFHCEICGLMFKRQLTLDGHMIAKHDPNRAKNHVCALCGKSFFTDEGLRYHFDSNHKPESEWKLACPNCPRRFYRRLLLNCHLKTCSGEIGALQNTRPVGSPKSTRSTRVPRSRKTQSSNKKVKDKVKVDEEEMTDKSTTDDETEVEDKKHSTTGEAQEQHVYQNAFSTLLQCSSQETNGTTTAKNKQSQQFPRPLHYTHVAPNPLSIPMEQQQVPVPVFPQAHLHQQQFNSFQQQRHESQQLSDMEYSPEQDYRRQSSSSSSSHSQLKYGH